LCNLVAQGPGNVQGGVSARGAEGTNGAETEAWEIIYFKLYKRQIPVVEQTIETAATMLGSDKSRGYLPGNDLRRLSGGANLDGDNPEVLLNLGCRYFRFLPKPQREAFLADVPGKTS
jgi:hypothetical protein